MRNQIFVIKEIESQVEIIISLLDEAEKELEFHNEISFLRYFYSALRHQIPILEKLDSVDKDVNLETNHGDEQSVVSDGEVLLLKDSRRVKAFTDRLLIQTNDLSNKDLRKSIYSITHTPDNHRKEELSLHEIDSASRILHDEYISNQESVKVLERILQKLNSFLESSIILLCVVVLGLVFLLDINFPIGGFPLGSIPAVSGEPLPRGSSADGLLLYVFVILTGIFGALSSNLLKFYDISANTGPRIPYGEFQVIDEIIIARILIGGTAAAFLYTVLLSGVLLPDQLELSALFVMALAFTAGFSDRLLLRALSSVEERLL